MLLESVKGSGTTTSIKHCVGYASSNANVKRSKIWILGLSHQKMLDGVVRFGRNKVLGKSTWT